MAGKPHVWLKAAIEEAVEGVTAWPLENTAGQDEPGYNPPYAIYRREGTEREPPLSDGFGATPGPDKFPPMARYTVEVFADSYVSAWDITNAIVAAVHRFKGSAGDETILRSFVVDALDGEVVILEGRKQPTFIVEVVLEIHYAETE